ncbi:MAG: hypothetical protein ACYTGU_07250 [Planctomycetota bacterium]|jgi:hypothetical protein
MRLIHMHLVLAGIALALAFAPPALALKEQRESQFQLGAGDAVDGSSIGDDFRVRVYSGFQAATGNGAIGPYDTDVKDRVRARRYGYADLTAPGITARVMGFDFSAESEIRRLVLRGIDYGNRAFIRAQGAFVLDDQVVAVSPERTVSSGAPLIVIKSFQISFTRGALDVDLTGDVMTRGHGTLAAQATAWRYASRPEDCVPMRADVEGWFHIASFLSMEASATKVYDVYKDPFDDTLHYYPRGYPYTFGKFDHQAEIPARAGVYDGVSDAYWTEVRIPKVVKIGNMRVTTYETVDVKVFREIGELKLCGANFESDLHACAEHFTTDVRPYDFRADIYGSAYVGLQNHEGLCLLVVDQKVTVSDKLGGWAIWIDMVAFFSGDLIGFFTGASIPFLGDVIWKIEQEVMGWTVGRKVIHTEVLAAVSQRGGKWVQFSRDAKPVLSGQLQQLSGPQYAIAR